jgi:hypothetical protein
MAKPMVGIWDWGGIAISTVIALGGLAIGAWGFKRARRPRLKTGGQ